MFITFEPSTAPWQSQFLWCVHSANLYNLSFYILGLSYEYGHKGITVQCLCPGPVRTDMLHSIFKEKVENLGFKFLIDLGHETKYESKWTRNSSGRWWLLLKLRNSQRKRSVKSKSDITINYRRCNPFLIPVLLNFESLSLLFRKFH